MIYAVLGMTIFMSLLMLGFGLLFMKWVPKEINYIFGYRTTMSMKNQDTWKFAHNYAGKVWVYSGLINILFSAIIIIIFKNTTVFNIISAILIAAVQPIILIVVIPLTEIALRKAFDKDGNKK